MPSHNGKYFLNFQHVAMNIGMPLQIYLSQGESLVTRARNNAVADFFANKEWTHLFWIDSGIGFNVESAFRLLRSDYEVAAGVYPLKREIWSAEGLPEKMTERDFINHYQKYKVKASIPKNKRKKEINLFVNQDGFMEMTEAPIGFKVIKRSVLEKMMEKHLDNIYLKIMVFVTYGNKWVRKFIFIHA